MDHSKPKIIFFTGTDTDVGKTYVAVLAVKELLHFGRSVGVYKPVASGCSREDDALLANDARQLWEASGRTASLSAICPQRFLAPLAPPAAAQAENISVDESLLVSGVEAVSVGVDVVVVEGAGGLMSPVSENMLNCDLARKLNAGVIVVAANRLGAIHQVLATITAAAALRLPVYGIVLNEVTAQGDASRIDNASQISRFSDVPLLGEIPYGATASGIDWKSLLERTNT